MKRQIGSKHYGSALGDWLKGRRGEIATTEAGDTGDAGTKATELAEVFAAACGLGLDDYAKVESGDVDPTPEQADALAAELTKRGVECTGADLLAIDKREEPKAEDPAADDEKQESADAEMRKAFDAIQHEAVSLRAKVGETDAQLVTFRSERDEARATVAILEPLAAEGRRVIEQRRSDVLRRVELRGGKSTDRLKETVAKAGLLELGAIEDALGLDPLVDSLCKGCGEKAETLYRSSATPEPGEAPKGLPVSTRPAGSVPTSNDHVFAARAYCARQAKDGKSVSEAAGVRAVRSLPAAQVFELADEYASRATN